MLRRHLFPRFLKGTILFLSLPAWGGIDAAKDFLDGEIGKTSVLNRAQQEAEMQSRKIIDGYHFLVSMAPETKEKNLPDYTQTITNSAIADYQHKGLLLEITFTDGATYEYFGITKPVYQKMVNAGNLNRFAKRSIYPKYTYRKSKRILQES